MMRYDWTPANEPPDSRRIVVVWQERGEWDMALYDNGAWISHTGFVRDVTDWHDVKPPK